MTTRARTLARAGCIVAICSSGCGEAIEAPEQLSVVLGHYGQRIQDKDLPAAMRLGNVQSIYHAPAGEFRLLPADASVELLDALRASDTTRPLAAFRFEGSRTPLIADGTVRARFASELPLSEIHRRAAAAGAASLRIVRPDDGLVEMTVDDPWQAVIVARRLHESGFAEWAHPVFIRKFRTRFTPNDQYLDDAWHLDNIEAERAWDTTRGVSSIRIAILDSGIDMRHPDLAAKIVHPRDTQDGDNDPTADASSPHGTACAGLATAITDNSIGVAGVCPSCGLIPVRIMSELTSYGSDSAVTDAFYWAADRGAAVISSSWGFDENVPVPWDIAQAITYAADKGRNGKGSVVLFAAGNEGRSIHDHELAALPNVLAIGAADNTDAHFDYSNYGNFVALAAPAGSMTTDLQGSAGYSSGAYTDKFGGTSAATPVAAGVAGLIMSAAPNLTRQQVTTVMIATAEQVGSQPYPNGRNGLYGYGRVNAAAAMQMLTTGVGRACTVTAECGSTGLCVLGNDIGNIASRANACTLGCGSDSDCPGGLSCATLASGARSCLASCTLGADCGGGQSCWPTNQTSGTCWTACTSSADCGGEACNGFGLCGDNQPPGNTTVIPGGGCSCDTTTICDQTCACDVDCPITVTGQMACNEITPSGMTPWLGVCILMALRRRSRARR
ncbi:MAG: S8 family serine peptidase [Myxococcota bacterium]